MKYKIKSLLSLLAMFISPLSIAATDSSSTSLAPTTNAQTKINKLYYLTFAADYDPETKSSTSGCPKGTSLVSGSKSRAPYIRGSVYDLPTTGGWIWQCLISIPYWSDPKNNSEVIDSTGIDTTLKRTITQALNLSKDQKYLSYYDSSLYPKYTGYQYVNNQFIPVGIGGSGVGCTNEPYKATINCKNQTTGKTIEENELITTGTGNDTTYYTLVSPGSGVTCNFKRNFPNNPLTCESKNQSIPAGQAWIGQCCQSKFQHTGNYTINFMIDITSIDKPEYRECKRPCTNDTE